MSNLNLQKLREWVWPWPWTFKPSQANWYTIYLLWRKKNDWVADYYQDGFNWFTCRAADNQPL